MQKIILFYKFYPIADSQALYLWQKTLADNLNLRGRLLISPHGINGTLGGDATDLKAYIKATKTYQGFKDTKFKWSDGGRDNFPKLSVKVRDEIVSFGAAGELKVGKTGVIGGGRHLKPTEVHDLVNRYGDEVVFFDGRNAYEAAVGRFKGAVVPGTTTSKDFIGELDSGKYDALKGKKVVTYCTGGIRCEVLSSLMKTRGFSDVYQLDGGIASYGRAYGDEGLWEGSLYVFDGRLTTKFTDRARDIGDCIHCAGKTSNYVNCALPSCNQLVLICPACLAKSGGRYHTKKCQQSARRAVSAKA